MEGVPVTHTEKTEYALEPWLKQLRKIPSVSATIRNTIGKERVQKFFEIITSESAIEAEVLYLSGRLNPNEASQYWYASGEFTVCTSKLKNLAIEISDALKPRLVLLVENEIRGFKNEGIGTVLRSLSNLIVARNSVFTQDPLEYPHQTALLYTFYYQVVMLIGIDLVTISDDDTLSERVREKARSITRKIDTDYKEAFKLFNLTRVLHDEQLQQTEVLSNTENVKKLDSLLGYSGKMSDSEREKRVNEVKSLLDIIQNELPYKKAEPKVLSDNHIQIFITLFNKDDLRFTYARGCAVRINFTEDTLLPPTFKKHPDTGMYMIDETHRDGIIDFSMDPMTGDLKHEELVARTLEQTLSHDRYLALQHYLLRELAAHLESSEATIEDFFDHFEPNTSQQEHINQNIHEDSPYSELANNKGEGENHLSPHLTELNIQSHTQVENETLTKHEKNQMLKAIQSARAEDILRAMRTLCGEEDRIAGSHHIFKSPRTGVALTLPRHSRSDKKSISFRLILNNLKVSGYSIAEFVAALE